MASLTARRLMMEAREVERERVKGDDLVLAPVGDDLHRWRAVLTGPEGTPFQGGHFELTLSVPLAYPNEPPKATFVTRVFHPNVHFKTGEVCLDVLKSNWSPAWTLANVCRAITALLAAPDASSPLNCDAGNLVRSGDERGYNSLARMYTALLAMTPSERAKVPL